jgi:hypothetical protein
MDVQTDIVDDFLHGCLVSFIDDESGASYASHIADRSPLGDNPRYYTGIKHPLNFFVKPYGLGCTTPPMSIAPEPIRNFDAAVKIRTPLRESEPALNPKSTIYWRCLFIGLETIVVVRFLEGLFFEKFFAHEFHMMGAERSSWVLDGFVMSAWLFLLIASLFFLRSLRGVALVGWIVAFGALIAESAEFLAAL